MDQPEIYHPRTLLESLASRLYHEHPDLRVTLSTTHPTYEEALEAIAQCVHGIPGRILLPSTNPALREKLSYGP